jgi:hypothetical protein
MMVVAPLGIANAGGQIYHFVPGMLDEPRFGGCDENCAYPALTARGERTGFVVNGVHERAEQVRRERALAKRSVPFRLRLADCGRRAADYLVRASLSAFDRQRSLGIDQRKVAGAQS